MKHLRPALVMLLGITLLTGVAYPLLITGIAQLVLPSQANGSLVTRDGKLVGSTLIGQNFARPDYFHGRPSATTATDANGKTVDAPYNADNSTGSNLGPTAKALHDRVAADVKTLQAQNPGQPIPADLVTTSGSGLDPDITPADARAQVPMVSKATGIIPSRLERLITAETHGPELGFLGSSYIVVLTLNEALQKLR